MLWLTILRLGSIRRTRFSAGQVILRGVSPYAMLLHPAGNRISVTILFSAGSIRDKVVLSSVKAQTLSGETARPARTLIAPVLTVFEILPALTSTRASVPSPQLRTQTLPKPSCGLPHGLFKSETGSTSSLAFGSRRSSAFFDRFEIQIDWSTRIDSGDPSMESSDSGFSFCSGI